MQINSFSANVVLTLWTGWNLARIYVCQQTKYNNEPIFKISCDKIILFLRTVSTLWIFILDIVVAKYIIFIFLIEQPYVSVTRQECTLVTSSKIFTLLHVSQQRCNAPPNSSCIYVLLLR